jgi:hypothetical protein
MRNYYFAGAKLECFTMAKLFSLLLVMSLLSLGCATKKVAIATPPITPEMAYSGNWLISIAGTPLGDVQGMLRLSVSDGGAFEGSFTANGTEYPLRSAQAGSENLRAAFFFNDYGVDVEMKLNGEPVGPLNGVTNDEYMTTAERQE